MKIRLLSHKTDLLSYSEKYKKIGSSLEVGTPVVPLEYLSNNLVYGFYKNGQQVAGFIIGINAPFRSIEIFTPSELRETLMVFLNNGHEVCELAGFWIQDDCTDFFDNIFIWNSVRQKINIKGKKFFMGGTFVKGMANLCSFASYAHLICTGKVNDKPSWVIITWTRYAIVSLLQVIIYKVIKGIYKSLGQRMSNYIQFDNKAMINVAKELKSDPSTIDMLTIS